jgi:hypothetical protein
MMYILQPRKSVAQAGYPGATNPQSGSCERPPHRKSVRHTVTSN